MPQKNTDFMQELDRENRENVDDHLEKIRREAYRNCEEATITAVEGECPYGHKKGDCFRLTNMNCDGMCGSLYQPIHTNLVTLHYGGTMPWGEPESFTGTCLEGRVHVQVKRVELPKPAVVRTENKTVDMARKWWWTGDQQFRFYV